MQELHLACSVSFCFGEAVKEALDVLALYMLIGSLRLLQAHHEFGFRIPERTPWPVRMMFRLWYLRNKSFWVVGACELETLPIDRL